MDLASFDAGLLQATLRRALGRGGDFAEVYVEDRDSLGLRLEDGRIEATSGGRELGAAVRLLAGEHTFYAYSDAVDEAGLFAAADAVAAAVRSGDGGPAVVDLGGVHSDPG
ncbi:MAG TPA: DNA gyrase modulator, partial [Thermoleophilia bacterium]|nr:DNA gyrase modulator [Thermoleophilia bacterium]